MSQEPEFSLDLAPGRARIAGVMRLVSPAAYAAALADVARAVEDSGARPYEIDVADLQFLNSSGITALSRLVLSARAKGTPLSFVLDESVLWQKKTLPSLSRLYPGMTLRAR